MGEVYLALHRTGCGVERLVALKTISEPHCHHQPFVKLFLAEARITATLTHPHIVQVYDAGLLEGHHFLAMEFVDGPTLRQVLRHPEVGKLPLPAVLTLGVQLCSALEYAHGKRDLLGTPLRIVHRDVSPDNVIVDGQGYAKLCDFGISKSTLAQLDEDAESGTWKGKKGYMSPEQCEHRHIDCRSDVFSLGIVLWEMLTGTRLFAGDNLYAVMSMIREAEIPPPDSVSDCPAALSEIVIRALRRDSDERYARAADLERALTRFVHETNLELGTMPLGDILRRHFPAMQRAHDEIAKAVLSAGPLTEVTVVEAS